MTKFSNPFEMAQLYKSSVSIVRSVGNSNTSIKATFHDVVTGLYNCDEVQEARKIKGWKHTKPDEYKRIKSSLPAFTLTTFGETGESVKDFKKEPLNPYIIIDIDNIEVNEENTTKLNSFPFVLCTGVSLSGEGYYSVVKIDNEIVNTDTKFKSMFNQLAEYYKNEGYEIDKSCSNVNRLRIVSPYYIKWSVDYKEPFYYEEDEEIINNVSNSTSKPVVDLEGYEINDSPFNKIIEPYNKGEMYNISISWANTIYNIYGESGYNIYMDIMQNQPDKKELVNFWKQASKGYSSNTYCIKRLIDNGYLKDKAFNEWLDDIF